MDDITALRILAQRLLDEWPPDTPADIVDRRLDGSETITELVHRIAGGLE